MTEKKNQSFRIKSNWIQGIDFASLYLWSSSLNININILIFLMFGNEPTLRPVNISLQFWLIAFTFYDLDNDDVSPGISD